MPLVSFWCPGINRMDTTQTFPTVPTFTGDQLRPDLYSQTEYGPDEIDALWLCVDYLLYDYDNFTAQSGEDYYDDDDPYNPPLGWEVRPPVQTGWTAGKNYFSMYSSHENTYWPQTTQSDDDNYPKIVHCQHNGQHIIEKWFCPYTCLSWTPRPIPLEERCKPIWNLKETFIYDEFTAQSGPLNFEIIPLASNKEECDEGHIEWLMRQEAIANNLPMPIAPKPKRMRKYVEQPPPPPPDLQSPFFKGHYLLVPQTKRPIDHREHMYVPEIACLKPKRFRSQAGEEYFAKMLSGHSHDIINSSDDSFTSSELLMAQASELVNFVKNYMQSWIKDDSMMKTIIDAVHKIAVTIHNVFNIAHTFKDKLWIIYQSLVASGIVTLSGIVNFGLDAIAMLINFILWMAAKGMNAVGAFTKMINPFIAQAGEDFTDSQIESILHNGFYALCGITTGLIAQGGDESKKHEHTTIPLNLHYWAKCVNSVTSIGKGLEFFSKYLWTAVSTVYLKIYGEPLVTENTKVVLDKVVEWMKRTREAFTAKDLTPDSLVNNTQLCTKIVALKAEGEELAIQLTEVGYGKHNYTAFYRLQQEVIDAADAATTVLTTAKPRTPPVVIYLYGKSSKGKSFMQTCLTNDLFKLLAEMEGKKFEEGQNLQYVRYAIDPFWSGYVNQEVTVLDDLGQVDDKENTTRNVEEIVHMANVAPFLLNMAGLSDKGKKFFTSRLLLISTNIPFLMNKNHMAVACPEAFYRRIDIQVEVDIKPDYLERDANGFERIVVPDAPFSRECYRMRRMNPFTGKHMEDQCDLDYKDLLGMVMDLFIEKNKKKEAATEWLKKNPISLADMKGRMRAQAGEEEEIQQDNNNELKNFIMQLQGKVPTNEDILRMRFQKKQVHSRAHGWLHVQRAGLDGGIFTDDIGNERTLAYSSIYHPECYNTDEKKKVYLSMTFEAPKPTQPSAPAPPVSAQAAPTLEKSQGIVNDLIEPSIKQADTLYEKGKQLLEDKKSRNSILKAILLFTAALGALGGAYAIYKFFKGSDLEGQGERGNQGSASRGMDPKIKGMFTRTTEKGKEQKLNRVNWKGQSGVALDPILTKIEENSLYIRIANGQGEHYHCGGLAICERIVLMPKHILLYFHSDDSDNRLTIETLRGDGESFTYDMKELDIFEEASSDLMFVVLPVQVDPFPNILKHFIKASDLKDGDVSNTVMCVRLKNTINRCYSYNTVRSGNIKYSFEYGGEKVHIIVPSTLMYPGHNEGGYCGNPVIVDNNKFVGRLAGLHLYGDGKRGGAATLTFEYMSRMIEEIKSAVFEAQSGWEEHVNEHGTPQLKYSDKIKFVGSIDPKKAHRMAHNTKIIESALYNRWHPAKTAPAMLAPHPPIYPLQNAIDKVGERHERVQPDMDLVEAIAAQERLKISYFVPARLLTDEECIHGVPSWKYTKGLYMGTSGGFDPNRGEKGYKPTKGKSRYFNRSRRGNDWHYEMTKEFESQKNEAESFYRAGRNGIMLSELNLKDERRPLLKAALGKTRPFVSAQLFHLLLGRKYFGAYLECLALSRTKTGIAKGTNPHSQDWQEMFERHVNLCTKALHLEGDASNFDWTSGGPIQSQWVKEVNMWYRVFAEQEFYDTYGQLCQDNCAEWEALQRRLAEEEQIRIGLVSDATQTIMILVANDVIFVNEGMISGYFATFEHNSGNSKIIHQYCPLKRARDIRRLLLANQTDAAFASFSVGGNTLSEFEQVIRDTDSFNYKVSDLKKLFELEVGGDDFWLTLHELIGWYNFYMHIEETKKLGWTFTSSDKSGDMYKHKDLKDVSFLKRTFRQEHGKVFAPMPLEDVLEIMYWVSSDMEMGEALHENARSVFLELGHHGSKIFNEWTNKINTALLVAGYEAVPMTYDEWLTSFLHGDFQDEQPIKNLDYVFTAQSGKEEEDISTLIDEMDRFFVTMNAHAQHVPRATAEDKALAVTVTSLQQLCNLVKADDEKDEVVIDIETRMTKVMKALNDAIVFNFTAQAGPAQTIKQHLGMMENLMDAIMLMDVPNSVKERFRQVWNDAEFYAVDSDDDKETKMYNIITDYDHMQKMFDEVTSPKFIAQSGKGQTAPINDVIDYCTKIIEEFRQMTGHDLDVKYNHSGGRYTGETVYQGIHLVSQPVMTKLQCKAQLCKQIMADMKEARTPKFEKPKLVELVVVDDKLETQMKTILSNLTTVLEWAKRMEAKFDEFSAQSGKEEIVSETTGGHTDLQGLTTTVDIFEEDVDKVPTAVQPYFMGNDPYNTPSLGSVLEREYRIAILKWNGGQTQNTLIVGSGLNFPYALLNIAPNLVEKKNRFHYWRARRTIIRFEITGSQFHSGWLVGGWLPHTNTANTHTFRKDNFWQTIQCNGFFLSPNAQKNVRVEIPYTSSRLYTTDELTATDVGFFGCIWLRVLAPLALANQTGTPEVTISVFAHMEGIDLAAPSLTAQAGGPQKEAIEKTKQGVISGTLEALSGMAMSISKIPLGSFSGGAAAIGAGLKALSLGAKAMGYNKPNSVAATQPMYLSTVNSTCDGSGLNTLNDLSVEPGGLIGNGPNFFGRAEDEMLIGNIISKPGAFDIFTFDATAVAGEVVRKWGVHPALKPVYLISSPPSIYRFFHTPLSTMAFLFKEWSGSLKFHVMISCNNSIQGRIRFSWHPTRAEIPTDFTTGEGDFISRVINFQGDTTTSFTIPWLKPTACDYVPIGYGVGDAGCNGAMAMSIVNPVTTSDTVGSSAVTILMLISAGPDFQFYRPGEQGSYEQDSWTYEHKFLPTGAIAGAFQAQAGMDSSVFNDIFKGDFPPLNPAMGTIKQRMVTQENVANLKTLLHRYELKRNGNTSLGILSFQSLDVKIIDPYDDGANEQIYPSTFDFVNWCYLYSRGGFNYMLLNANDVALNMEQTGLMFIQNGTKADQPGSIVADTMHQLYTETSWGRDGFVVEDLSYKKAIQFSLPYWGRNNFVVSPTACFSTTWSNYDRNNFVAWLQYTGKHNSDQQNFFVFQAVKDDFHAGWFCTGPVMYYKVNAIADSEQAATGLSPANNMQRS